MPHRISSSVSMTVIRSSSKSSIAKSQKHSLVIHSKIRFTVSSQRRMSSMLLVRSSSQLVHSSRKISSKISSPLLLRRSQSALYSPVRQKRVYVRSVMVSTSRQQMSSLSVLQSVSSPLSRSVSQVLSSRCVRSTRDESRKRGEISRRVSLVSRSSSRHVIRNTSQKSLHSMRVSHISKRKVAK